MESTRKCPCCGGIMDWGRLYTGGLQRILWSRQARKRTMFAGPGDVVIRKTWTGKTENVAWHCRAFGRILVENP